MTKNLMCPVPIGELFLAQVQVVVELGHSHGAEFAAAFLIEHGDAVARAQSSLISITQPASRRNRPTRHIEPCA